MVNGMVGVIEKWPPCRSTIRKHFKRRDAVQRTADLVLVQDTRENRRRVEVGDAVTLDCGENEYEVRVRFWE